MTVLGLKDRLLLLMGVGVNDDALVCVLFPAWIWRWVCGTAFVGLVSREAVGVSGISLVLPPDLKSRFSPMSVPIPVPVDVDEISAVVEAERVSWGECFGC